MNEQEIRTLFTGHSVPLSPKDVWAVQGTPVIKHAALERLSAALKLIWDMPTIVRAERDECVVLVRASRPDKDVSEWSFGEALINGDGHVGGNYKVSGKQASYVFAMAEKRGKDRVIIKLAGLHGAYSEEEADDFKASSADAPKPGSIQFMPPVVGAAQLVQPDLVKLGNEAADRGMPALTSFIDGLTDAQFTEIGGPRQAKAWAAIAKKVDAEFMADQQTGAAA